MVSEPACSLSPILSILKFDLYNVTREGSVRMTPSLMGKHRMSAAISLLDQQIQIIQDELDELENVDGVSTVCQELISSIESAPYALLPVTKGPMEVAWDRWFQGAQSSRNRRRWI